ncbi:MAG: hypothetical protein AABY18_07645 [Candidatus Thermoplasmatota archaeon]|mgnify:CR=1 FL=1
MKGLAIAALLALQLALVLVPAAQAGPEVTVLLHHPDDDVDIFGFPYSPAGDYFTTRYATLAADDQRFDFPFFVADGVLPLEKLPDSARPYESARLAYSDAADARLGQAHAVTMRLATTAQAEGSALVVVTMDPVAPLPDEDLHLMVALAEDPVHYLAPPALTNGIEEHRFTVRAVADLGVIDLTGPAEATHAFALDDGWAVDRLIVAAWLQQDAPSPRFDAREVVQATHVALGGDVVQDTKGVLLEMLSATWCKPCLYGDLAIEAVAVAHGAAEPLALDSGPRYFQAPPSPVLAAVAAALAGAAVAWWGGRK